MMRKPLFWLIAASFLLTACLALQVPMHSDDFGDALKPLTISSIIYKYLHWGGRITGDAISTSLAALSTPIKAIATAFAATLLLYTVSTFSKYTANFEQRKNLHLTFLSTSLCYWIFNPALGHGTFWIVGSAYYLWTSLYCVVFFKYTIDFVETSDKKSFAIAAALAFFAGCSMEALSVGVMVFIGTLLLAVRNTKGTREYILILFLLCFSGFLVLVLAPGNAIRMAAEGNEWMQHSLGYKIHHHFTFRYPRIFKLIWPLTAVAVAALAYIALFRRKEFFQHTVLYAALFIFCAIVSAAALVAAPWTSGRGLIPIFIFILCSFSCILQYIFSKPLPKSGIIVSKFILGALLIFFSIQYILMFRCYYYWSIQNNIREKIIYSEKNSATETVMIPNFVNSSLIRKRTQTLDQWNGYESPMALYYNIPSITFYEAGFNYALIETRMSDFKSYDVANTAKDASISIRYLLVSSSLPDEGQTLILALPKEISDQESNLHITWSGAGESQEETLSAAVPYDNYVYFGIGQLKTKERIQSVTISGQYFTATIPIEKD